MEKVKRSTHYSLPQILLHWVSALVILWTLSSGFYVAMASVLPETKALVGFINVSLTALLIPVFVVRVYFFFAHKITHRGDSGRWAVYAAWLVHVALYMVTAIVLATGVLMMERDIDIFGWVSFRQPLTDPYWTQWFEDVHIFSCMLLSALVALHIAAVIKHEFSGTRVLRRMWPRRSACVRINLREGDSV